MYVDVDGYKIVNVYKSPPIRLQVFDLPVFPHPCLYAGDCNYHHVDWGYDANSADLECLVGWEKGGIPSVITSTKHSCNILKGMNLAKLLQFCLPGLTGNEGIDGLSLSRTSTFHTLSG